MLAQGILGHADHQSLWHDFGEADNNLITIKKSNFAYFKTILISLDTLAMLFGGLNFYDS